MFTFFRALAAAVSMVIFASCAIGIFHLGFEAIDSELGLTISLMGSVSFWFVISIFVLTPENLSHWRHCREAKARQRSLGRISV